MVFSSLYILDLKGKLLLSRDYRGDVPSNIYERFVPLVLEQDRVDVVLQGDNVTSWLPISTMNISDQFQMTTTSDTSESKAPIFWHEGIGYIYVKVNNLYCKNIMVKD
jgi:hypothetical protein